MGAGRAGGGRGRRRAERARSTRTVSTLVRRRGRARMSACPPVLPRPASRPGSRLLLVGGLRLVTGSGERLR